MWKKIFWVSKNLLRARLDWKGNHSATFTPHPSTKYKMPANINKTSRSYNKYDQGGYEEAVMMGDPPAKEYNTYMMQVT